MTTYKKKPNFLTTEEGSEFKKTLRLMAADTGYCTEPSYTSNIQAYPDSLMPFVDKHLSYILSHPNTDPQHYLSNLRLMTRVR